MKNKHTFFIDGASNKVILLIHGLTGAPIEMSRLAKLLKLCGFSSYVPLITGHCGKIKDLTSTTWKDWYNGLVEDLEFLYNKYGKVYIAGLCAGGTLGLLLAKNYPYMVKSIAIYSPILSYNGWNMPFYYSWANCLLNITLKLFPFLRKVELKESTPFGIKNDKIRNLTIKAFAKNSNSIMDSYPLTSLNEYLKLVKVVKKDLKSLNIPLLLIQSIYDDITKYTTSSLYIQKHYGGICDVHLINNSYHLINIDHQKEIVAKQTALFFNYYSK